MKILSLILTAVIAAVVFAAIHIHKKNEQAKFPAAPFEVIAQDVQYYDNWAIYNLLQCAAAHGETCCGVQFAIDDYSLDDLDCRVVPYAQKLLEESHGQDEEWFRRNSWRYGFVMSQPAVVRFVGVFHSEQMYYSGLTLDEYLQNLQNTQNTALP